MMPMVGIGTFEMRCKDELRASIRAALASGCRLIDTAQVYRNEALIGDILWTECDSLGLSRSEIFIVSKLQTSNHGYDKALQSIQGSLEALRTHYIDLFLIHWPGASKVPASSPTNEHMRKESWRALCMAYAKGLVRSIGVSNYTQVHLRDFPYYETSREWIACGDARPPFIMPMVNQIEVSPAWFPHEDIEYCRSQGIVVQGYSTLGRGQDLLGNSTILELAHKYRITPAQLCLQWSLQSGIPVIPKSSHADRVVSNLEVLMWLRDPGRAVIIQDEDMCRIMMDVPKRKVCWDPSVVA